MGGEGTKERVDGLPFYIESSNTSWGDHYYLFRVVLRKSCSRVDFRCRPSGDKEVAPFLLDAVERVFEIGAEFQRFLSIAMGGVKIYLKLRKL